MNESKSGDESDISDIEEDNHSENSIAQHNHDGPVLRLMPCCVCYDNTSAVTMHPCGHLKVCSSCWSRVVEEHDSKMAKFIERDLEEEYRPKLKCPFCMVPIQTYSDKIYT